MIMGCMAGEGFGTCRRLTGGLGLEGWIMGTTS